MNRRDAFRALTTGLLAGVGTSAVSGEALPSRPPVAQRVINLIEQGADPSGRVDAAAYFQSAIDQLSPTGGVIYIPAGTYLIGRTLEWMNPRNARMPGILFMGDGSHSTVLRSAVRAGPLLRVRGVPMKGPVDTTFFWGGGIRDLTLDGSTGGPSNDGLELLGWWYGEIVNCRIWRFKRHGIRAITDLRVDPNPDYTATTMFVRSTWIERCGGWGFIDDGGTQGAPGWSWDRTVFVYCRRGGALVQSGSHGFVKCSFAGCGWRTEGGAAAARAYGLYFGGGLTATSTQWVEGCEFDTNLTAHISARFLASSTFINNRFIFNDRFEPGRLCPRIGVEIGSGDAAAAVRSVEFRQNFFRFDKGGVATAFDWVNTANVRDVEVSASIFSDHSAGTLKLTRYRGMGPEAALFGYAIRDREGS